MSSLKCFHGIKIILIVFYLGFAVPACHRPSPEVSCDDILGCVRVEPGAPLKIGILQALTGKVASIGKGQIRGIELALEDRNGKVAGHDVLFQIEDTGCSPEGGANAVLKILADPEQIAILGTTCSGAAATVSRAMSSAGFTMVSGNNSATFLTAIGGRRAPQWQPGYFRTAPNEENAGKAAAMYAAKVLGVSKAAVINDGDIYTQGLTHSFVKMFKGLGGKVVLDTAINKGDKEMAPVLTATINSGAEFLFCPLFQPEGNYILLKTREMSGFENIPVMSAGALIDRSFLNAVGEKARGMYFVGPSSPATSITKELGKKYTLKYGAPPSTSYYLSAYDAATLLFEAIEKVAVPGHVPGTLYIGRQALRKTLYGIKKFKGATGLLTCDEFGDCGDPAFDVFRMDEPSLGMEGLLLNVQFSYSPVGQREEDVAGAHK